MPATPDEVARYARIASQRGLLDLMGHVSGRVAPDRVTVTPSFTGGRVLPGSCGLSDLIVVDLDGRRISGHGATPFDLELDLAIYRARPTVNAVVVGAPETAVAFGIAGADVLPLSHGQADLIHAGIAFVRPEHVPTTPERAESLARALGSGPILQLAGLAVVSVGSSLLEAVKRLDGYESLAALTLLARRLTDRPRAVTPEEAKAAFAELPHEKIPSRDPRVYYESLDPFGAAETGPPGPAVTPETSATDHPEELKRRIALACRILAAQGSLVAFYEHVSHRLAADDRFLMSPARNFAHMRSSDMCEVATEGDCAWLSGPHAPAPFRWFHRDIFEARPDVNAIVHTHEVHGRALALSGVERLPVFRNGAAAASSSLPTYPIPSMGFPAEVRREAVRLLGGGSSVHLWSHGSDYVGASLEEATVAAIQREQLARLQIIATEVGTPSRLCPSLLEELPAVTPPASAWWTFHAAALTHADVTSQEVSA
jgi:ribulose-5-phosphate 4-epimerase/fuculose-1-phosphate aldolase